MIRKRLRRCFGSYRNGLCIMFVIGLLIFVKHLRDLHHSLELKNCKKLLVNEFSERTKKYYINFKREKRPAILNTVKLRHWIQRENAKKRVLNMDIYGPLKDNSIIFVVLVTRYSSNIQYLLASLSEVKGIHNALIIFSHAYVDLNVHRLIKRTEFCRVLQIFFPYSIQVYPNKFPGYDRNDCPSYLNKGTAIKLNCTSAMNPDVHGHYRNPSHVEKKHHWWWTANNVFEKIPYSSKSDGIVVFLDTNFYIYENFVYMAKMMKNIAKSLHQCDFISLGPMKKTNGNTKRNTKSLEFTTWNPSYHSSILAIDVLAWNSIKSYYKVFCDTDDYSWSRSVFDVSINRDGGKAFKVLSGVSANALQTSIEDVMDCDVVREIVEVINLQKNNTNYLFPPYFEVSHNIDLYEDEFGIADYEEIRGGWNDERDKQLCYNMTINKTKRNLVTMSRTTATSENAFEYL